MELSYRGLRYRIASSHASQPNNTHLGLSQAETPDSAVVLLYRGRFYLKPHYGLHQRSDR